MHMHMKYKLKRNALDGGNEPLNCPMQHLIPPTPTQSVSIDTIMRKTHVNHKHKLAGVMETKELTIQPHASP